MKIQDSDNHGSYELVFEEESDCEHCARLEPFEAMFFDEESGIGYCADCMSNTTTEEQKAEIQKQEIQAKLAYHQERVKYWTDMEIKNILD